MRDAARIGTIVGILLGVSSPVRAMDMQVFGGYGGARVAGTRFDPGQTTLHGFEASLGVGAGAHLGFLVDASGDFGRRTGADLERWSLLAGLRLQVRAKPLVLFVQALGGAVRTRESLGVLDVTLEKASTDAGVAAGGGLDLRLGARWALRVQGDATFVKGSGEATPRLAAGLVFGTGR